MPLRMLKGTKTNRNQRFEVGDQFVAGCLGHTDDRIEREFHHLDIEGQHEEIVDQAGTSGHGDGSGCHGQVGALACFVVLVDEASRAN